MVSNKEINEMLKAKRNSPLKKTAFITCKTCNAQTLILQNFVLNVVQN